MRAGRAGDHDLVVNEERKKMISVSVILDGDGAFNDISRESIKMGQVFRVSRLAGGMTSGASSVAIGVRLKDGTVAIGEVSAALLHSISAAIQARDELEAEQAASRGQQ